MLTVGFCITLAGCTFFYCLFLLRIREGIKNIGSRSGAERFHNQPMQDDFIPQVSVLLPVRNEQDNVADCLQSLLHQDYPREKYEIIVIDDDSEDETVRIIKHFQTQHPHIVLIQATHENGDGGGKKKLITQGISTSSAEIIITTDADCAHPARWLPGMVRQFCDSTVSFISGPIVQEKSTTLFERIQSLEFLGLIGVGAGFIGIGFPRLCNGANIAYRKSIFEAVGGYGKEDRSSSGDDEFLMQKIAREFGGVVFVADQDAIVRTSAAKSVRELFEQRKRWASKGIRYTEKFFIAFLLSLFAYFSILLISPIFLFSSSLSTSIIVVLWLLKWLVDWSVLSAASRLLSIRIRSSDFIIAEMVHVPYIFLTALFGTLGSFTWKKRMLKR